MSRATLYLGDALTVLKTLPDQVARCCVTSPPYWGLRDYGVEGQMGLEETPAHYFDAMVEVFGQVHRVLTDDGTLWLNMGDSYADGGRGEDTGSTLIGTRQNQAESRKVGLRHTYRRDKAAVAPRQRLGGLKPKDMMGLPWLLALALREDGWFLRADIVWHKPNAMPESVGDRPTKAHEYVFLLAKSRHYVYNGEAIGEPLSPDTHARVARGGRGSARANGGSRPDRPMKAVVGGRKAVPAQEELIKSNQRFNEAMTELKGKYKRPSGWNDGPTEDDLIGRYNLSGNKDRDRPAPADGRGITSDVGRGFPWYANGEGLRNARSVWTIPSQGFPGAHFATFPEELARRCILAGSNPGDTVLDPFGGSGTVAQIATGNGREAVYIDLNPDYLELAVQRIGPMLCDLHR